MRTALPAIAVALLALRLAGAGGSRTLARATRGTALGGFDLAPAEPCGPWASRPGFQRIVSRRL